MNMINEELMDLEGLQLLSLDVLKINETAVIHKMQGEDAIHFRLQEMGLVAGTAVTVKRLAPLGDPMEILVRGYRLSIRKEDARQILVKKV